ncbi:MAG: ABC transporter ATP-binding protein, partial [Vulcanimicrobiaceae bacterium]
IRAAKRYAADVVALDDVSFEVRRGELLALLGPSGCGKSTILNLIGCIDTPSSGQIEIDGIVTSSLDDDALTALRREKIGTVFQFFNLLPTLTVAENVALPLVLQRRPRREIDERVLAVLDRVELRAKQSSYPAMISGGEMQRAAVARAIVHEPSIVLADEPTGNLDSVRGDLVLGLLRDIASSGQAIVMATHSAEAAARADRRIHLRDGRIERIS